MCFCYVFDIYVTSVWSCFNGRISELVLSAWAIWILHFILLVCGWWTALVLCSLLMILQLNLTLHCSMQFVKSGVKRYIFTVFLSPFYLMYWLLFFLLVLFGLPFMSSTSLCLVYCLCGRQYHFQAWVKYVHNIMQVHCCSTVSIIIIS